MLYKSFHNEYNNYISVILSLNWQEIHYYNIHPGTHFDNIIRDQIIRKKLYTDCLLDVETYMSCIYQVPINILMQIMNKPDMKLHASGAKNHNYPKQGASDIKGWFMSLHCT